jgi:hypothetical protein
MIRSTMFIYYFFTNRKNSDITINYIPTSRVMFNLSVSTILVLLSLLTDFVIYNNYKNHIINNKSDKSKNFNLRMAARHCQWRGANAPLSVASLLKRATASGVFV